MLLIFLLASLLFLYFFIRIGFLYWAYLVIFFISLILVLSVFSDDWKNNWKEFLKSFFLEYIMYVNFFIIVLWIYFILKYFYSLHNLGLIVDIKSIITLLWMVTFFSVISIIFNKQTFIKVAFFWLFMLWNALFFLIKDIKIFYYAVAYINSLAVTLYLLFYVIYGKVNKYLAYVIFIFTIVLFFIILNNYFISSQIILSFTIQFVIFLILSFVIYINKLYTKLKSIKKKKKEILYEMRLFWYATINLTKEEETFLKKYEKYEDILEIIVDFFVNSPKEVKIIFSLTNTVPIVIASWVFFHQLETNMKIQNEIFYWLWAIMYFVNFLLFKKLDWFVVIQRLFAFFVINFVTYFTIIDFSGKNYLYISIWGIIWNLFTTVLILFIDKKHDTFDAMDYLIWSIVNFIWVFVNIYFLFKVWLSYYLSVWIALLYLGLYLYLYRIVYKKYFLES